MPLAIYLLCFILTFTHYTITKTAVTQAAREASRTLAVLYDETDVNAQNYAKQEAEKKAKELIEAKLNIEKLKNITIQTNIRKHKVIIEYDMPVPAPGMAKLLNSNAGLLDSSITIRSEVEAHTERGKR